MKKANRLFFNWDCKNIKIMSVVGFSAKIGIRQDTL